MATQDMQEDPLWGMYTRRNVRKWGELICLYEKTFTKESNRTSGRDNHSDKSRKWVFRGHRMDWRLETSLDRAFSRYGIPKEWKDHKGVDHDRRDVEKHMIRSFMRKAQHYIPDVPYSDDLMEWLATMRHYGAPTRMLDWTYSFYVAVYNAVENWNPEERKAGQPTSQDKTGNRISKKRQIPTWPAVWALDLDPEWLEMDPLLSTLEHRVPDSIDKSRHEQNHVVKYLMETPNPRLLVYNATGFRLNERLTSQQGTFLVQGTLTNPFWENLKESFSENPKRHFYRIVLKIDGNSRDEILRELNNMNINHATLYPDLEGFAKSLERHMAYPENWGLEVTKKYK